MCDHKPPCPPATAPDHDAARMVIDHPEQGWALLCNGMVVFSDTGELYPDGHMAAPVGHDQMPALHVRCPVAA